LNKRFQFVENRVQNKSMIKRAVLPKGKSSVLCLFS